jgi:hypothetical protein
LWNSGLEGEEEDSDSDASGGGNKKQTGRVLGKAQLRE